MTTCATMLHRLLSYGPQSIAYARRVLRERGFSEAVIDAASAELSVMVVGKGLAGGGVGFWKLPKTPHSYTERPKQLFAVDQRPARRRRSVCPHCGQPMKNRKGEQHG